MGLEIVSKANSNFGSAVCDIYFGAPRRRALFPYSIVWFVLSDFLLFNPGACLSLPFFFYQRLLFPAVYSPPKLPSKLALVVCSDGKRFEMAATALPTPLSHGRYLLGSLFTILTSSRDPAATTQHANLDIGARC
jgi:hypothetical protein